MSRFQITDAGIGHIAEHCKNIRRINIKDCQVTLQSSCQ